MTSRLMFSSPPDRATRKATSAVVVIGVDRGERGSDGGRVARLEPPRGRVLPPLGRAALPGVSRGGRPQGAHLTGPRPLARRQLPYPPLPARRRKRPGR